MATTVPAGDPGLSQNAAPAQLAWQNTPKKTYQFSGLADADAAAGALPNPTSPAAPAPAQDLKALGPAEPAQPQTQLGQVGFDREAQFRQQYPQYATTSDYRNAYRNRPSTAPSAAPALTQPAPAAQAPTPRRFGHFLQPRQQAAPAPAAAAPAAPAPQAGFAAPAADEPRNPNAFY